jgi:hypothetical protein
VAVKPVPQCKFERKLRLIQRFFLRSTLCRCFGYVWEHDPDGLVVRRNEANRVGKHVENPANQGMNQSQGLKFRRWQKELVLDTRRGSGFHGNCRQDASAQQRRAVCQVSWMGKLCPTSPIFTSERRPVGTLRARARLRKPSRSLSLRGNMTGGPSCSRREGLNGGAAIIVTTEYENSKPA